MGWVPWTTGELERLRRHYPFHGHDWDGWADELPGRTWAAIQAKATFLGLRRYSKWTEGQVRELLRAVVDVSERVGHSPRSCVVMAHRIVSDEAERRSGDGR